MERTYIRDMVPGTACRISGFVDTIRQMRWGAFVVLKDITGKVQVTFGKDKFPEIVDVTTHSVITVEGILTLNPSVKMGGKEVIPDTLCIDSLAEALPIADDSEIDSKMDYRWIDLRRDQNQLMMKVQTTLTSAMREYLLSQNFIEIHTPKLIGAASESGSDVFEVKYFDTKAYLAQSPQFYKQMAMASGRERIF